MLYNKLVQ